MNQWWWGLVFGAAGVVLALTLLLWPFPPND